MFVPVNESQICWPRVTDAFLASFSLTKQQKTELLIARHELGRLVAVIVVVCCFIHAAAFAEKERNSTAVFSRSNFDQTDNQKSLQITKPFHGSVWIDIDRPVQNDADKRRSTVRTPNHVEVDCF